MAAVVGATAIGLSPVQPAPALRAAGLPVQAAAEIALTGTSIPWETIATVATAFANGGSLEAGVTVLLNLVGTEFVKEATPVVTAAAGDVVKYVGTALAELLSGPDAPQIDVAAIILAATTAINAGNLPGAVQALNSALSAPLTQISQVLLTPEFQAFVTGKISGVLGALPEILRAAVQTVIGIDIKPVIDALSGVLGGLLPAASTLTATPALSAAAEPSTVVGGWTAVRPVDATEVPAVSVAPEPAAPEEDSAAKAPAGEAAPEAPAGEAAPEAQAASEAVPVDADPAVEVVEATPAAEVAEIMPSAVPAETVAPVPAETVAPVPNSLAVAPEAAATADPGPAVGTRLAKPGPRGHAAESRAAAAGRG
jgi:hypothetical protein